MGDSGTANKSTETTHTAECIWVTAGIQVGVRMGLWERNLLGENTRKQVGVR